MRDYTLKFIEKSSRNERAAIVMLHGYGMFKHSIFDVSNAFDDNFCVYSLQAPFRIGPGAYRWFNYSENTNGEIKIDISEYEYSMECVNDFLKKLSNRHIDKPVIIVGHSQGGMVASSICLRNPDLINACVMLSARIPPEVFNQITGSEQLNFTRFYILHGRNDEIIPLKNAYKTINLLTSLGAVPEHVFFDGGHDLADIPIGNVSQWVSELPVLHQRGVDYS